MVDLRRLRKRKDAGYVTVLFAISLTALAMLIGFAVDLGSWYLHATRMQRASDAAALSAAVSLPDTTAAAAAASDALKRNGFVDGEGSISANITAIAGSVKVELRDSAVPTYFLSMVFPNITIGRESQAEKADPIPLGNPYNVFGYARDLNLTGDVPYQGFWGAINGPCSPKEDGDFFQARRDANKFTDHHECGEANATNPDYSPSGYNYLVEVPEGASNVSIRVADGVFSIDESGFRQDQYTRLINDTGDGFDTTFSVTKVMGKVPSATDPNVGVTNGTRFLDGKSVVTPEFPGGCWGCWYTIAQGLGPGTYRVNVATYWPLNEEKAGNWAFQASGFNVYALMASEASKLNVTCDTRKSAICPKVVGYGAVSTYNNGASGTADYYLAEIDPGWAGSQLEVPLWDPGEGMETMELLAPDGSKVPFSYTVNPPSGAESAGGPTTALKVSGKAPKTGPNIQGDDKYNDRLVTLRFTVPTYTPTDNNKWFKLSYTSGTGTVTDRITFGVNASAASPVHLSNGAKK